MRKSFEDMAQREANACNDFIEYVQAKIGCDRRDGALLLDFYRRKRLVSIDIGIGRFKVAHGALLDVDVLEKALAEAKEIDAALKPIRRKYKHVLRKDEAAVATSPKPRKPRKRAHPVEALAG